MISSYNEAAAAKAPTAQGTINFIKAEHAAQAAALDFPWDITSPEGLIAFFGEKLKSTNTDLRNLMQGQQNRSETIKNLETMSAMLANGEDLKPGSPSWPEFQRLAALVGPSLGASADANAIRKTLDDATKSVHIEDTFDLDNTGGVQEFYKAHPGATKQICRPENGPQLKFRMTAEDGAGIAAADAKKFGETLKALSGNMQSENQMDAIRVQELVGRISQIMSLASNILHKFDEAAMGPIANIK